MAWASWATPMVATSRITRGARNRRRTTTSSTAAAKAMPTIRLTTSENQNPRPWLMVMRASSAAAGRPMLPTAKLMTRVER
jgi:hypothetical protein